MNLNLVKELKNLDLYFAENYELIKLNQTIQKIKLSFSVSLSVFQSFFSWFSAPRASFILSTASSLFGTQRQLTHH